jgi:pectinesterase
MKTKLYFLMIACMMILMSFSSDAPQFTIYMIGDSTMANKSLDNGNTERGWGMVLQDFFNKKDVVISNHAVNGRSSKSFIDEGRWQKVLDSLRPGDYVVIQFGHNDEKPNADRHTDPGTTFDANLEKFVNETRAKGATPILYNSIVRRIFKVDSTAVVADDVRSNTFDSTNEGKELIDTHGAYLKSPRDVAAKLNVPFIDANQITHDMVQGLGPVKSKKLFMWVAPGVSKACINGRKDNTHLNIEGAHIVAGALIKATGRAIPEIGKNINTKELRKWRKMLKTFMSEKVKG